MFPRGNGLLGEAAHCGRALSSLAARAALPRRFKMVKPEAKKSKTFEPVVLGKDGRIVGGPRKLSDVVADALQRWYREAEEDARAGDVKAAALLGNMMIQGYGCKADPERGRVWVEKARRKGYRMQGVYCEI